MKKFRMSFKTIFLFTGILPMLGVSIFLSIIACNLSETNLKESQKITLRSTAMTLKEYFQYDVIANGSVDYEEYADHEYMNLLTDEDIQQTLFEGDTRFLTSIKGDDGSYFENTKANPDIWAAVSRKEDYYAENVIINHEEYMVYYTPVYADASNAKVWGMAFSGIPMKDITENVNKLRLQIGVIVAAACLVLVIPLYLLAKTYTDSLAIIVEDMHALANGDLSEKSFKESFCTEFNSAGAAIVNTQRKLNSTVGKIRETYNTLHGSVESVDDLSNNSANEITSSSNLITQMANTAMSMAENVQNVNAVAIDLGNSIESISDSSTQASDQADVMSKANEEAMRNIREVYDSNERSVDAIIRINDQTKSAAEAVNNIRSAADVIANIAGQTNLLALNASIEAARAGESGRGFAVVAENIRELAEQSNASAQDIRKSVEDVVSQVGECAEMANNAKDMMVNQQTLVRTVAENMKSFSSSVSDVASGITKVSNEVNSLNSIKETIVTNVTDLSAISEENAASAAEVSTNIDNIASNITGTKDESTRMRGMAQDLNKELGFFK